MTRHYETYNRKRNIFCGFRLSPEEKERLKKYVAMSGMTERDYISQRALQEEIVVVGNTRIFKALKDQFEEIIKELRRIKTGEKPDEELIKVLNFSLRIYEGLNNK